MSRYGNFREFYEDQLRPDLEDIDRRRKEVNKRAVTILLITAAAILTELLLIPGDTEFPKPVPIMFTFIAGMIVTGIFSKSFRREY